ncbi:carbon-nitrogen hydrolase family protein [Erythrobacter sp.]|uniref:carbon-nitrogen hydrolase family protein n=1 Tax=Erythrobacter sp. TaxID=1042 RepID=UPI001B20E5C8|nr:carbon-nitrogen hydrolase family protein [Erythrobacter sp.]MBO6526954.1 carbon-nitrogen hydrolase family protein [Erythrobacter sp.]MBO6528626.1 carbon-nitrogen hydrolase family protein [Erythrobacter sp.]
MAKLGVAAIQIEGDGNDNVTLIEEETRAVARRFPWVDIVVFGELAAYGPSPKKAEPEGGPLECRMADLARETGLYLIPGSYYQKRDGAIYNVSPVFNPEGEIIARHDKFFPFLPYEKGVACGDSYCVFDIPGVGRLGLAICYDMWFPEAMRTLAAMGAEAIILPTLTNTIDRDVELAIARANAAINQCYFIDVNCSGTLGNGRSAFYGPGGEVIYESGEGRDVAALRLDLQQVRDARADGWHGLGQVLKSFRDTQLEYPLHASAEARMTAMAGLGELTMPHSEASAGTGMATTSQDTETQGGIRK